MIRLLILALLLSSFHAAAVADEKSLPVCSKNELRGYRPDRSEINGHRGFAAPGIAYPAHLLEYKKWGNYLTLKIDRSGKVICYAEDEEVDGLFARNAQRASILEQLSSWRYAPFFDDGKVVEAVIKQQIYEWQEPEPNESWPTEYPHTLHISLERTSCLGSCPAYKLDIDYDGNVRYEGIGSVDVEGVHRFKMAPAKMSEMIQWLQASGAWSAPKFEQIMVLDAPDCKLTITIGKTAREIGCGGGTSNSLPLAWLAAEEIERRVGVEAWIHFSDRTFELLKAERFDFHSPESINILERALLHPFVQDDSAVLELLKGDALLPPARSEKDVDAIILLEEALATHHVSVVNRLIAKGALVVNGMLDQNRIDESFQEAIKGGRLDMVERIWEAGGPEHRPSLSFTDTPSHEKALGWPVTLLLHSYGSRHNHWEGKLIAQWLSEKGCDLHADRYGETLLDIAIKAEDVEFEKYLRDIGVTAHRDTR